MKVIDRDELYESLSVNDNYEVKVNNVDGLQYYTIENFLKYPEKALGVFNLYPAINGVVYTPGMRQNFTPMDLVPIVREYGKILNLDPTKFITSSILAWKDMKVWENSWMPHKDYETVCNLWLKDYSGGTAFYRYKHGTPPKGYQKTNKDNLVSWQNFEGDDDWELYHIIPSVFNTVAIYDGRLYHGTYATFDDNYRYSLISFYQKGDTTYE
jgi:hypothetical protein